MNYQFDVGTAVRYGVNQAIIIANFQFWIIKNRANGSHNYDGRTWTYNSVQAFTEIFPFWTESQIRYCLQTLVDSGVLVKGEYNNNKYDRTAWYAFAEESKWICEISNIELGKFTSRGEKIPEPIPDNKPDNKPDNIPDNKPDNKQKYGSHVRLCEKQHKSLKEMLGEDQLSSYIDKVNDYCASKGKKYKDYAATIRNFWRRDGEPKPGRNPEGGPSDGGAGLAGGPGEAGEKAQGAKAKGSANRKRTSDDWSGTMRNGINDPPGFAAELRETPG